MGLTVFHVVFPEIQTKCGEYLGILRGTLSLPQNIVMDLNNVYDWIVYSFIIFYIGYTDFAEDRICERQIVQNKQTQGLHLVYIQQSLHVQTN